MKTGPLEDDGLRVSDDGLKADEVVAVGAIQQLRPKMEVDTGVIAMPTPGADRRERTEAGTEEVTLDGERPA